MTNFKLLASQRLRSEEPVIAMKVLPTTTTTTKMMTMMTAVHGNPTKMFLVRQVQRRTARQMLMYLTTTTRMARTVSELQAAVGLEKLNAQLEAIVLDTRLSKGW